MRDHIARLSRLAHERADSQARHIPWPRLLETRIQYLEWQEFYLWTRSIMEVEERIPDWLGEILKQRCPGFLEDVPQVQLKAARAKPDFLRLEDWIDDHVFGFARQEGWFSAISFYAVREPRYQRAQACWSKCIAQWKNARPVRYPSFDEWKAIALQSDDPFTPGASREGSSSKFAPPQQLAEAVVRYIEWEALAYWARPALEACQRVPAEVAASLERECPGFLRAYHQAGQSAAGIVQPWTELMLWIGDHFFQRAKADGWFDAIIATAQIHPRAIRTQEYADHCDERWSAGLPVPYPTFEEWRRQADAYVERNG